MTSARLNCAFAIALAAAFPVLGEFVLFDFESEAEQSAISLNQKDKCFRASVTNGLATSGEHAILVSCDAWKEGAPRYPAFRLASPLSDWRGYNRIAIDIVSKGGYDDALGFGIVSPGGSVRKGPRYSLPLPDGGGYVQHILPLDRWTATVRPENVEALQFTANHPSGYDVIIDRIRLLKKGEEPSPPQGQGVGRDLLSFERSLRLAAQQSVAELEEEQSHCRALARFWHDAWKDPMTLRTDAMLLGWATSMEKILPRGDFSVKPLTEKGLSVRLAQNECESVQLVVAPTDVDAGLRNVRVKLEDDLRADDGNSVFCATNIDCDVVGYVNVTSRPPYRVARSVKSDNPPGYVRVTERPYSGWIPDPILGFMDGVDVRGSDVQSFWIRVRCPYGQKAGVYKGALLVSAESAETVRVPFSVTVNCFSLDRTSALPLAVSFSPSPSGSMGNQRKVLLADPQSPCNMWKRHEQEWVDFLADYYISYDALYHKSDLGRIPALKRLRDQGRLGLFNLGVFNCAPKDGLTDAWRDDTIPRLVRFYEEAKELGIEKNAYVYGCDEAKAELAPHVKVAVEEIKRALPGVKVFTTARDPSYGMDSPLDAVDWFTPLSQFYDAKKADASRKAGHKVWWYICCDPVAPYANMFVESPAIEGRILMGAQTVKYRPDGFLYYAVASWQSRRCITAGPFTDWNPRSHGLFNGDGSWTCAGPDGMPLPTIRLENFRDGLEDYAYAMQLEKMLSEGRGDDAWRKKAQRLLAVPANVGDTMKNFTGGPSSLYSWRDKMADLIEAAAR